MVWRSKKKKENIWSIVEKWWTRNMMHDDNIIYIILYMYILYNESLMHDDNIFWKTQLWRSSGPRQDSRVFCWFWDTKQGFLYKLHFFRYDFRGVQKQHQHLKSNLNDLNAILHPRYPKKIDHTNASKLKATAMNKNVSIESRTFTHIWGTYSRWISQRIRYQSEPSPTSWTWNTLIPLQNKHVQKPTVQKDTTDGT